MGDKSLMESIQIINTAIIKSKEKQINIAYEERLKELNQSPAMKALSKAITLLSESEKVSRDQAALMLIETIRDLDKVWTDYVTMEGIDRLKDFLKNQKVN